MAKEEGNEWFLVVGGLQGRFDHVLGSMNTMHILKDKMIVMIDGNSMAFLLNPGKHTITYRFVDYRTPSTVTKHILADPKTAHT